MSKIPCEISYSTKFKKDLKRIKKRGYKLSLLNDLLTSLVNFEHLDSSYRNHVLIGNYDGMNECHLDFDWVLIYNYIEVNGETKLFLQRTGTHSDVF